MTKELSSEKVIEDLKEFIIEGIHNLRWDKVKFCWQVGEMLEQIESIDKNLEVIAKAVGYNRRELFYCLKFYRTFAGVSFEKAIEKKPPQNGKVMSWNKIKMEELTDGKEPEEKASAKPAEKDDGFLSAKGTPAEEKPHKEHTCCPNWNEPEEFCRLMKTAIKKAEKKEKTVAHDLPKYIDAFHVAHLALFKRKFFGDVASGQKGADLKEINAMKKISESMSLEDFNKILKLIAAWIEAKANGARLIRERYYLTTHFTPCTILGSKNFLLNEIVGGESKSTKKGWEK